MLIALSHWWFEISLKFPKALASYNKVHADASFRELQFTNFDIYNVQRQKWSSGQFVELLSYEDLFRYVNVTLQIDQAGQCFSTNKHMLFSIHYN